tara:strand:+ start:1127 stop:1414 length:288 start_codon:yes stop_codon:yes gene_type:complete
MTELKDAIHHAKEAKKKNKKQYQGYYDEYEQLKGFSIKGFYMSYDGFDAFPTFILHRNETEEYKAQTIEFVLSQDPEGNGGGFAFIEGAKRVSND